MTRIIKGFPIKHVYQDKSGWCGIACWEMLFKVLNKKVTQKKLSQFISDPNWGTSHADMENIAKTYLTEYQAKENWTSAEIKRKLKGKFIILNIWDDFPTGPPEPPDGHYVVLNQIEGSKLKIYDPSGSKRLHGLNKIYYLSISELKKRWYDFLDKDMKVKTNHWAIVVDPKDFK